jgi:hypothetical protein
MNTIANRVFTRNSLGFLILAGLMMVVIVASSVALAGDVVHLMVTTDAIHPNLIDGTPVGVAASASHANVVTAEKKVFALSPLTGEVLITGGQPISATLPSEAGTPVAIAMNDVGYTYIATNNGRVYRLTSQGLAIIASTNIQGTPVDITVGADGFVYIATSSGRIFKRDTNLGPISDSGNNVAGTPTAIYAVNYAPNYIFVTTSGGIVYCLASDLNVLFSGQVPGTPIDVAADTSGNVVVATSGGILYKITNTVEVLASRTLTGTLIGIDLDFAGHVVAANSAGTVFVGDTSLSYHNTKNSTVTSLRAISVDLSGNILVVGGTGAISLTPVASVSTSNLDFARVRAGTSSSLNFTVTSSGTAPLNISSVTINTTDPAGVWSVTPVVPPTITLAPTNSQTFTVTLSVPASITSDTPYNATLSVTTNDPTTPVRTISAAGTGYVPVASACYSANTLTFDRVNTGTTASRTFSVQNCGEASLQVQSVTITPTNPPGVPPAVWSVSPAVPPFITLAPTNSQTFTVTLGVPVGLTSDVNYSATISVATTDPVTPTHTITATGTGHVPVARIEIPPAYFDIDYREVEIGYSFSRPLLIRNTGDLALSFRVSYVDPADPDSPHFILETDSQNFTIPPSGERIFRQTFKPQSTGNKDITLRVDNTNDRTFTSQDILLHGVGTPPTPIDAVLVLDRSGSMAEGAGELVKIEALKKSGILFTELLREGVDYLGLTKYDHENSNILDLGPITTVRSTAQTRLSETNDPNGIAPRGATGIGGAMQTASSQYALSPDSTHKPVMVVLTDGHENRTPLIRDILNGYDSYPGLFVEHPNLFTYSVGLGLPTNVNADRLQEISNRGAGGFYLVTGNLEGLNLFNLENFYFKIFADAIGHTMVIDPADWVASGETLEVPVGIITEDREALFFFIGELPREAYVFELVDPKHRVITSSASVGGMSVQMKQQNNWSFFRVKFPAPDINRDYVGEWKFRVRVGDPARWAKERRKAGKDRMSFAASVGSDYRLAVSLTPEIVPMGNPIHMRATLTDGGWPSPKATVTVTVKRPDGVIHFQRLFDDGAHGDEAAGDAIFGGDYTSTEKGGVFHFLFRSDGTTERGEKAPREASRDHFVGEHAPDVKVTEPFLPVGQLILVILSIALLTMAYLIWEATRDILRRLGK